MLPESMREELIRGLTDIFQNNISMIILYGSVARNEATDESDVDVAIIVKDQMDKDTKAGLSTGSQTWIFVMRGYFPL